MSSNTRKRVLLVGPFSPSLGGIASITETLFHSSLSGIYELIPFDIHKRKKLALFRNILILFDLFQLIIRKKIQVAIVQMSGDKSCFREFLIMFFIRLFTKTKIVLHFHGALYNDKANFPFRKNIKRPFSDKFIINIIFNQAQIIVFLSEKIKEDFISFITTKNKKKARVIENFVNSGEYHLREKNNSHEFNVLFVGRLSRLKGFVDIIKAVPNVHKENKNIHFHFCGTRNPKENLDDCNDILEEFIKCGIVHLHGPIDGENKKKIFSEANVLILPSYKEIFPIALLEAMAQGIPVITTKVGVVETFITEHENGFLVEQGNIEDISNKIIFLANQKELCIQIGKNNLQKIKEKFNSAIAATKFVEIINDVLQNKTKVLYFIQLPPPLHGVSAINKIVYESDLINADIHKKLVEIRFSNSASEASKLSLIKIFRLIKIIIKLCLVFLIFRPKIIYFSLFPTGKVFYRDFLFVLCIKIFGVTPIYHLHGKGIDLKAKNRFDLFLYRFTFRNSNIIHLSNGLLNREINPLNVKNCNCKVVENGIVNKNANIDFSKHNDEVVKILFLSHVILSKGIQVLLDAILLLSKKNLNFVVHVVGGFYDSLYKTEIENYIIQNNLSKWVQFHGPKYGDDKYKFLKECHIFVHPTLDDAFPLVLLEAMQFGLPIISTYEGAIPEIIDNGATGILIKQNDSVELSANIEKLILERDLRISMGTMGFNKFSQNYTIDIFQSKMKKVFDEITSS